MQDRHDRIRTLTESVMLCPTYQTSWVMENLHDKSGTLPDPDTFTVDIPNRYTTEDVLQEIDSRGFYKTYNYFYLPIDFYDSAQFPLPLICIA